MATPLPPNGHTTAPVPAAPNADDALTTPHDGTGQPLVFDPPKSSGAIGTLGPYQLMKELGRGGMGVVYAAVDTRLERRVALKVMLPLSANDGKAKERFVREARAVAKITHDNVVTVYEADEWHGVPYIAMQYLEGEALDRPLKSPQRLSISRILRIGYETANGLEAAHRLGLVHRDIKPGNLWLEAPSGRVKVLDFGLAKPVVAVDELTSSGAVVGTPNYMSPEQARGEQVDHRSDLFSLGVVLYRLCTGQLPFHGSTTMAVLMALGTETPPSIEQYDPTLPTDLAQLIQQLLAKRAAERPRTAAEVAQRLQAIAEQCADTAGTHGGKSLRQSPVAADEDRSTSILAVKTAHRQWRGLLALLLGVVGLVGVVIAVANIGRKKPTDPAEPPAPPSQPNVVVAPETPANEQDHDRLAATWVIQQGGKVQINGDMADIGQVGDLPATKFTLTVIDFYRVPVTDAGFECLRDLAHLKELILSNTDVSDAVLVHVKGLKSLTGIWLQNTKVTSNGLAHLHELHDLSELVLTGTAVKDSGLHHLSTLKNLTGLQLSSTGVTNAGLVHLRQLKKLVSLGLHQTGVTDAGLLLLKEHENLKQLFLSGTGVTDTGLQHLQGLRQLNGIWLSGVKGVTDDGLQHLKGLRDLQELHVSMTMVTAKGAQELHATLPKCKIIYTGGTLTPKD